MTNTRMPSLIALLLILSARQSALANETAQAKPSAISNEKQQEKAVDDKYEAVLKASPDDAQVNFEYGQILARRHSKSSSKEALKCFRTAVKLDPYNIDFNRALFYELFRNNQKKEAMDYYYRAAIPSRTPAPDCVKNPVFQHLKEYNRRMSKEPETPQ
jgi:Tfp pilus assembly protein PilF